MLAQCVPLYPRTACLHRSEQTLKDVTVKVTVVFNIHSCCPQFWFHPEDLIPMK